jgi:4-hydroxy-tetrahydrodipicolinate synthase
MAGVHHYSTKSTLELAKHAEASGANSLLITPPYYMSPSVSQVIDHYRHIAEHVSLPIVLYHNVGNTNVDLKTEHLVRLFEEGAIQGVKMSNPDPDRICELLQATDHRCTVYAGIDVVAFEGLCHGAHGWISGIPSIVPRAARRLYEAIRRSDLASARDEWGLLAPLMRMEFRGFLNRGGDPHWFSVMKSALNMIGPAVNDPLPPIQPLTPEVKEHLAQMLRALGYEPRSV